MLGRHLGIISNAVQIYDLSTGEMVVLLMEKEHSEKSSLEIRRVFVEYESLWEIGIKVHWEAV